jgi:putative membrane protein
MTDEIVAVQQPPPNSSFELASRNTSLALQRTRMAADRTLMAVIRTSLSLISFGFTIFKLVESLRDAKVLKGDANSVPHFGMALVLLGLFMLAIGLVYHGQFMLGLRTTRKQLISDALIRGQNPFPYSFTFLTGLILFCLGIAAIVSMVFQVGPFG